MAHLRLSEASHDDEVLKERQAEHDVHPLICRLPWTGARKAKCRQQTRLLSATGLSALNKPVCFFQTRLLFIRMYLSI